MASALASHKFDASIQQQSWHLIYVIVSTGACALHNKPKEWPLLWLRINTWLLKDLGLQIMVQCAIQWWAMLMDCQILPWRCAVVVALRPCVATLAGSRVRGDLPLSVRLYVHSYRRRDVWRREVVASGEPQGGSPDVATN